MLMGITMHNMQSIAVTIQAPDGADVAVAVLIRPKRLTLGERPRQLVIDTTAVETSPATRPALRMLEGGKR